MSDSLEQQITDLHHWRDQIAGAIDDYREWIHGTGNANPVQELRLYDIAEAVRRDRLVVAFVAEFSRGKTETINALFFSNFKQRLLPCAAGRTTMCPMEIYWEPDEGPYIKVLPIETRKLDEGLAELKKKPKEWSKIQLDLSSVTTMQESLKILGQQKQVSLEEARELGLWDNDDAIMVHALQTKGRIEVPVWRHALINFPHPLLQSGLVILDTPGLNALGTEPDLTLSIIPSAHAVIFLLATDTGVTKTDMEIWNKYIRDKMSRKLAVLNKIDILWDDLKSEAETRAIIQSQVKSTAQKLGLSADDVFAISAQKALLARINGNSVLLERSGIKKVEKVLAEELVEAKHTILCQTVVGEASNMMKLSRRAIQLELSGLRARLQELDSLRGKNQDVVMGLMTEASADRKVYEATVRTFFQGSQEIKQMGEVLMHQLSLRKLDEMLELSRRQIGDSWTTHGLNQGMKLLIKQAIEMAVAITKQGQEIKTIGDDLYQLFHFKHNFELRNPPILDMTHFHQSMMALQQTVDEFCNDPVNVMTEKHFLVRKFFFTLANLVRTHFEQAHHDCKAWLKDLMAPLSMQINQHKLQLDKRTESLMKIHKNLKSLQTNLEELHSQESKLQSQCVALDQILLKLMKAVQKSSNVKVIHSSAALGK
jgi:hypothetical protein